jgi:plastocyanin
MRVLRLAVLGLAIAACGCGSSAPAPSPSPTAAVVQVAIRDNRFLPHRIVARRGELIRWTNHGAAAHTVASARLRLSSEAIRPGRQFAYRPTRAGRFAYYCTIHAGQTGILVVR